MLDARQQRLEGLAQRGLAGERERAHRAAVERVREREDRAAGPVRAGELDRRLDRLGARVAEVDAAAVARAGERRQALGELELRRRREVVGDVRERRGLAR